jgi:(S)-2-hydroxyglutarate dehydrogenase
MQVFIIPRIALKAKFTVEGSRAMKAYVKAKGLKINQCGKLVVAQNEHELGQLDELLRRGQTQRFQCPSDR